MRRHPLYPSLLVALILLLGACGGSGGGNGDDDGDDDDAFEGIDETADTDGDGLVNRDDVDDDNDGLIEIKNLEMLDWVRNDMLGTSLTDHDGKVMMDGCPNTGCFGYELVADLDFDTDGDGTAGAGDTYFNYDNDLQNNGWLPIGTEANPYRATFEGNGFRIRNLYINRGPVDFDATLGRRIGLFGHVDGAGAPHNIEIRNLNLVGKMRVIGDVNVGGLVGSLEGNVTISNSSTTGDVQGTASAGGLVGDTSGAATVNNSSSSSDVSGGSSAGGLIGRALNGATVNNSSATGDVSSCRAICGGLVGEARNQVTLSNSSAFGDVTGNNRSIGLGGLLGSAIDQITIVDSSATGTVSSWNQSGDLIRLDQRQHHE